MPIYEPAGAVAEKAHTNGHQVVDDAFDTVQAELDDYYRRLKDLHAMPSTEVFQTLSAISARASEMRSRLIRLDARRPNALRIKHVDPLLEEVDRQFKLHSRIAAMRQFEFDVSKGQT